MNRMKRTWLLAGTALLCSGAAFAEDEPQSASVDHVHDDAPDIIVTAPFERQRGDLVTGVSVLRGTELTRELRPTIGETLQRQPGVSSTSFGPNASRPVLRGFQGERIEGIPVRLEQIWAESQSSGRDPAAVADAMAQKLIGRG